eukprot:7640803-Alexandrium_andersonii.AAC.1
MVSTPRAFSPGRSAALSKWGIVIPRQRGESPQTPRARPASATARERSLPRRAPWREGEDTSPCWRAWGERTEQ